MALWLWFTVLFANFAEALAEGRGKAQAAALRGLRQETIARKLVDGREERVSASTLRKGDEVVVEAGEVIPGDGEVIEGIASVDESAVTGESAPVIRESGGDRSAVTGGTKVLSDRIVVRIGVEPGPVVPRPHDRPRRGREAPEDAQRDRAARPARGHDDHLPDRLRDPRAVRRSTPALRFSVTVIVALLVCLIPTTIGGLLSAIGIAGMDRLIRHNVIPMSGRAVEAAGDVDTMLLDKTGTITLGNRMATEFLPAPGVRVEELAEAAQLASLADETPGGPVDRGAGQGALRPARARDARARARARAATPTLRPLLAQTRMSGCDLERPRRSARARRTRSRATWLRSAGEVPAEVDRPSPAIAEVGGHAARGLGRRARARGRAPQGHREGRHQGALRPLPDHGPAHGHDHRRQPATAAAIARRGGSRRLHGRGHAGDEARSSSATSRPRASSWP